jgi:hypothetical protein
MSVLDIGASAGSRIGRYFNLVSALPSAALVLFAVLLAASGAWSGPPDWGRAAHVLTHLDAKTVAILVAVVVVLGLVLHPLQFAFVQFYEGYWGGWDLARRASFARTMGYWKWVRYLRDQQDYVAQIPIKGKGAAIWRQSVINEIGKIESSFPRTKAEFLPTRLGNVLRRYERIAGEPFGLNALTAVPQLALVAPDKDVAYLNDQRSALDLAVRLSVTSLLATALAVGFLWDDGLWLLVALVPYGLAYLSYRGAIVTAHEYGRAIAALVALNRHALYERLGLPRPADTEEERRRNETALAMMYDFRPADLTYDVPAEPSSWWWGFAAGAAPEPERGRGPENTS